MAATFPLLMRLWSFQIMLLFICDIHAAVSSLWQSRMPVHSSKYAVHDITSSSIYHHNFRELEPKTQFISQDLNHDQCSLYKVVMNQQLYVEYIHYNINLPDLKEFTLCMWTRFTNNTNDHPLFSYAVGEQERSILSWIANTQRGSFYMMSIDGHNLYRLNYPLQINRWYHSCQSWNGRTGEWQIWVNSERVGRGFNNRLVGHVIKGDGFAISGQEQRELDKFSWNRRLKSKAFIGMLGELTMLQMYGVALTAGKAHRDHKHHHAHHFENNANNNTLTSFLMHSIITGFTVPTNAYTTGGQINHQVNSFAESKTIHNEKLKRDISFADGSTIEENYNRQKTQPLVEVDNINLTGGLANFGVRPDKSNIDFYTNKQNEREPAEDEVKRIMNICNGCANEPFEEVIIISWRTVPKKLYSGALHVPALQICEKF